jgi:tripartite-type tricarboxylate transporter receptor subunit TctC
VFFRPFLHAANSVRRYTVKADQLGRELPKKRRRSEVSASKKNGSLMPSAGDQSENYTDTWSAHAVDCAAFSVSPMRFAMKLPHRRQFLHLAAGAAALPALSRVARAQAYPARPVRIVVGYPAGGVTDIYARLIGQWLSDRFGQSFVVENRPGAGGTIGVDAVVRAPADGYTLLLTGSNDAYSELLYPDLKYSYLRDLAPVAGISTLACVMAINPSFPAMSVPEVIAYAKANPARINYASAGIGSMQHMSGELFKTMTGIDMVHVPYRGGAPALSDLLAGQVQVMFEFMATTIPHVRSGALRALAVTSAMHWPELPQTPTVGEFVPGFEASALQGIAAPRHTAPDVIERLNREINAALDDPRMKSRIAELGSEPLAGSSAKFTRLIATDSEKWAKVIRAAGIKAG